MAPADYLPAQILVSQGWGGWGLQSTAYLSVGMQVVRFWDHPGPSGVISALAQSENLSNRVWPGPMNMTDVIRKKI